MLKHNHTYRRGTDESGIAMFTAMVVIFIATILAVAALALANHSLNAAGIDRNRTQSVAAAEAGLDTAVYQIQKSGAALPCTITPGSLPTTPAAAKYSVTISYYSTNPPSGSPLTCSGSSLPTTTPPASAEIVSKAYAGTAGATGRAMQAMITLTPIGGLNDAIFGHQIIDFSNNAVVTRSAGSNSPNADLYTDGNYICANNESVDGTVYAQGYISASNTCSVTGSWEAVGNVTVTGQSVVGGNIIAAGSPPSTSNVSLSSNSTVNGSVYASGTASGGHVSGSENSNATGFTVPTQSFPQENFDASDWTSKGYVVTSNTDCNTSKTDNSSVYSQIQAMSSATQDTVIYTTCALSWGNKTSITLAKNLVIFSTGGFTTNNQVDFESTSNSVTHNLEWIVPYDQISNCTSANPPDITTSNLTTFGNNSTPPNIDVMLYTPCDMTLSNQQAMTGQIYSDGTVTITNKFSMTYQQMPLYGVTGAPTTSYIAEYDYKREVPYT